MIPIRHQVANVQAFWGRLIQGGLSKAFSFALLGAFGGLVGALAGEVLLEFTRGSVPPAEQSGGPSICLVMDTSSSMQGSKLTEVKQAAKEFVIARSTSAAHIGVVEFASTASVVIEPTQQTTRILSALDNLSAGGSTAMHLGLQAAHNALPDSLRSKYVVLFSDGLPDSQSDALAAAEVLRQVGINLLAIGTEDANQRFLAALTGDPSRTIRAEQGNFGDAFKMADTLIARASLLDEAVSRHTLISVLRVAGWTAFVAACIGLMLIGGQSWYLRRGQWFHAGVITGAAWCLLAGCFAGILGQELFLLVRTEAAGGFVLSIMLGGFLGGLLVVMLSRPSIRFAFGIIGTGMILGCFSASQFYEHFPNAEPFQHVSITPVWALIGALLGWCIHRMRANVTWPNAAYVGLVTGILMVGGAVYLDNLVGGVGQYLNDHTTRLIGWCALGAGLGWCLAGFIPNLPRERTAVAGGFGGLLGGGSFILLDIMLGGTIGRLTGATILGFAIGLMVILVERFHRQTWLEVTFNGRERRFVNLGDKTVSLGSDQDYELLVPSHDGKGLRYEQREGRITCEDVATKRRVDVRPGDRRQLGQATVTVCSADQLSSEERK